MRTLLCVTLACAGMICAQSPAGSTATLEVGLIAETLQVPVQYENGTTQNHQIQVAATELYLGSGDSPIRAEMSMHIVAFGHHAPVQMHFKRVRNGVRHYFGKVKIHGRTIRVHVARNNWQTPLTPTGISLEVTDPANNPGNTAGFGFGSVVSFF